MAKKKEAPRVLEAENRKYELVLIFQPEFLSSAVEKKLKEFEAYLGENGGSVDMKDFWDKRDLAYPIAKYDQGIYVVYNLTLPSTFNKELDEYLRIDKDVIRFLLISVPSDYAYQEFEEEVPSNDDEKNDKNKDVSRSKSHKADDGGKKAEVKDKGKKADSKSLDKKLDSILEGGDIKV